MKKLLVIGLMLAGICYGGSLTYTTSETQDILDTAAWSGICELSFTDGATQTIADAAGYFPVTNFIDNVVDTGFTTTRSNITVSAAGRYSISSALSFDTASASTIEADVFTNGVKLVDTAGQEIAWRRDQGAATSHGSAACSRVVTLVAGTVVDFRFDAVGADEILTWHSGNFIIEKK